MSRPRAPLVAIDGRPPVVALVCSAGGMEALTVLPVDDIGDLLVSLVAVAAGPAKLEA